MSWQHAPWIQNDDILYGLPYTFALPSKYDIGEVKTIWNWSNKILYGLPYTIEPIPYKGSGVNNIYFGKIQPNDFYYGKNQVKQIYCGKKLVYSNE